MDKCDRLKSLLRPVSELDPTSTEAVVSRLDGLRSHVQRLSQGGKIASGGFEWVDSLLVKCLRQGAWLLMDNVNMCSAAVLDRLNGLLEPRGVLTLHERGVTPQGDLYTITPHPHFRLFLCMDPRHGEISRAMRNRGVEVAPQGRPLLDACAAALSSQLDLREQLAALGVDDFQTQCRLAKIHVTMSEQCVASFDISHLLRAAHLLSQYRKQKFDSREALSIACREIYVKTMMWCPAQYSTLSSSLQEMLADENLIDKSMGAVCPAMPIRTRDYLLDSTFTRVRHQAWLLHSYIQRYMSHQDTPVLLPTPDMQPAVDMTFPDAFPYLVMIAYDYASLEDLELRRQYILHLVDQIKTARSKTKAITESTSECTSSKNDQLHSKKKKKRKSNAQKSQTESCDISYSCDSSSSETDSLVERLSVIVNIIHNVSESQHEIMFASEGHRPFDTRRTQLKANTNGAMNNKCILLKHYYTNKYRNEEAFTSFRERERSENSSNSQVTSFTVMNYSELFEKGKKIIHENLIIR